MSPTYFTIILDQHDGPLGIRYSDNIVIQVQPNTSADRQGVQTDDRIIAVTGFQIAANTSITATANVNHDLNQGFQRLSLTPNLHCGVITRRDFSQCKEEDKLAMLTGPRPIRIESIRIKHSVLMGRARPIKTLCFMRIE